MKQNRRNIVFVILLVFLVNLLPVTSVQASVDVNILSSTNITKEEAKKWAKAKGASDAFINLADLYWKYASTNGGVNPAVAYTQSALETNFGNFGGVIDASFHNPCGMKVRAGGDDTDPNAHNRFNSWDEGVQAHLDHLALYAGANGYPRKNSFDVRNFESLFGTAKTVKSLTGKWTGDNYGDKVLNLYNGLISTKKLETIINLDSPWSSTEISGNTVTVSGWTLASSGVKKVNVYIDGKLKGSTESLFERKDVNSAYPQYVNSPKAGYSITADISDIVTGGVKKLEVETIDNEGSSKRIESSFKVKKLTNMVTIDSPWGSQEVSGNILEVRGWALMPSGISKINVYVDGKLKESASDFYGREDLKTVFPEYKNCINPGFTVKANISDIQKGGNKSIQLEVIGKDGTVAKTGSSFYLKKLETIVTIDSPWSSTKVTGKTLDVHGWALSASGLKKINVYIDGQLSGTTENFYERRDVNSAYPSYKNSSKAGYTVTCDISKISTGGTKKLEVEVISNDNTVKKVEGSFIVDKLSNMSVIDSPWGNHEVSGNTLVVNGWALIPSGIKQVNLYIDGKLTKSTTEFFDRKDVNNAYPKYPSSLKAGYTVKADISDIVQGGKKSFEVEFVGNDGSKQKSSSSFYLKKLETMINVDSPWNTQTINGKNITISGWALAEDGVKEVKVYIDGVLKATTTNIYERKDVNNAYPSYKNSAKCGFSVNVDMYKVASGSKKLEVEVVSTSGKTKKSTSTFRYAVKEMMGCIDYPYSTTVVSDDNVTVSGWILDDIGVEKVNYYLDNEFKVFSTLNVLREDVNNVYPGYVHGKMSGYSAKLSLKNARAGQHTVKVQAICKDGKVFEQTRTFYYKSTGKLIVLDPGHNNGGDDGAYSTHNGITYCERDLNMSVALKTKVQLEEAGYSVVLTRNPFVAEMFDVKTSLANRAKLANSLGADLFISIHQNSYTSSVRGTEVFYTTCTQDDGYPNQNREYKLSKSKSLASNMSYNIASSLSFVNRGGKDGDLFVLRNTTMPAVLVECGFISNETEARVLSDGSAQDKIARAIRNSVSGNI